MDSLALVEWQIEDGEVLLDRLTEEGIKVVNAAWVKPTEKDRWAIFIVMPLVDKEGPIPAYREVYRVLRMLENLAIMDSDVKLIGENHPVSRAIDMLRPMWGKTLTYSPPQLLGTVPIEQVYVYALEKKKITIYGLTFLGDPSGLLHLSFEEQSPYGSFIVEENGTRKEYPAQVGLNWVVAIPEGAKLARKDAVGPLGLVWNFGRNSKESSANEVLSLAKLGLHGFRILRDPSLNGPKIPQP
ncbi:MAG TPA: hypothetical protein VG097_02765 [Gemmata sp.]|jgi:hypothetical protein|nr:hypothetical protein [Gemmata sp.]